MDARTGRWTVGRTEEHDWWYWSMYYSYGYNTWKLILTKKTNKNYNKYKIKQTKNKNPQNCGWKKKKIKKRRERRRKQNRRIFILHYALALSHTLINQTEFNEDRWCIYAYNQGKQHTHILHKPFKMMYSHDILCISCNFINEGYPIPVSSSSEFSAISLEFNIFYEIFAYVTIS